MSTNEKESDMSEQKKPIHCDKRPWEDICRDEGHWQKFWALRNGPLPENNNVVNIKESSHG